MAQKISKRYTTGEEILNAITHGIGVLLSVAALVLLIVRAVMYAPDEYKAQCIIGFTIFGASLIILYLFSTLYHALPLGTKKLFGIFDHCSIYILIAGTYTAYCLTALRGAVGWLIFGIIWGLAVVGIVLYAVFGSRVRVLSVITYIPMGWLIIFAAKPLKEQLSLLSFRYLVVGGLVYTVGCVFYAMKKVKWMHGIWHLFVLGGSIMHFFSIYYSI
ncbi:MAG: PAQR family membrane homeostasis protein TrhA [Treponema sp.]|uniref:PAQR family membrane homeostasis protein TrhA n=1 Tax=Treponema sp. TaxID=166 RepID=UPI003FA2ECAC